MTPPRLLYVVQPQPVASKAGLHGLEFFLRWLVEDRAFVSNAAGLRARVEIERAVAGSGGKLAPFIALSVPTLAIAIAAAENPSQEYPGKPETAWLPFVEALRQPKPNPPSAVDLPTEGNTRSSGQAFAGNTRAARERNARKRERKARR